MKPLLSAKLAAFKGKTDSFDLMRPLIDTLIRNLVS